MKYYVVLIFLFFVGCAIFKENVHKISSDNKIVVSGDSVDSAVGKKSISLYDIRKVAKESYCAKSQWKDRGQAPSSYFEGMALVYGIHVCDILYTVSDSLDSDLRVIYRERNLPESKWDAKDSLSWYNSNFKAIGLNNDSTGMDTVTNVYTLLTGLGLRESTGKYCSGRHASAGYTEADTAEAGLFQASWGSRRSSPVLMELRDKFKDSSLGCFSDVFSNGVKCSDSDAKNWGSGDGKDWQKRIKECPGYAVRWAAVLMRTSGGTKGEFGPLRRKEAQIKPECRDMYKKVYSMIKEDHKYCFLLNSYRN